jgi:hypothetical protein
MIAVAREKKKQQQQPAPGRNCPRNIPREDCTGDFKPNVGNAVKDKKTYKNGTTLVVYNNGMVTINGYMLPPDHPDAYDLAAATDSVTNPKNRRDGDREWSIQSVQTGCNALTGITLGRTPPGAAPTGNCSSNFRRSLERDLETVRKQKAGPEEPSWVDRQIRDATLGFIEGLYCQMGSPCHRETVNEGINAFCHLDGRLRGAMGVGAALAALLPALIPVGLGWPLFELNCAFISHH